MHSPLSAIAVGIHSVKEAHPNENTHHPFEEAHIHSKDEMLSVPRGIDQTRGYRWFPPG